MKKSMLALAVLGAFAGVASAQSSVTLFGIVDLGLRNVKNTGGTIQSMATDGYNSSRLGFRGVEDLGGGLKAAFWLEAGLAADAGSIGGSNGFASVMFNRRATASLMGNWGEVRLGRDYTPQFWNTTVFDVMGTNGVASALNVQSLNLGTNSVTFVRANNAISYFLPSTLGGLYGQAQISAGEGNMPGNKHRSVRIGWASGPFNIAAAWGTTDVTTPAIGKHRMTNIGASYDLGVAKLMGYVTADKYDVTGRKQSNVNLGVSVPMGQGEIRASWNRSNGSGGAAFDQIDATQLGLGYVYNLSKRTALYATYSTISNKAGANYVVGAGAAQALDDNSKGYEFGLRHAF